MSGIIPIYQRLTNYYRHRILNHELQPGQPIDSINKIILKHQVSRETAKLVLKNLIDEKLILSKAGKGSFVTQIQQTTDQWGMVIPFYSPNIEQLITFLTIEAEQRNRKLSYFFHYNNSKEEERLVGSMVMEGYEAIIVVPNYDESLTAEFYRRLMAGNTSVVLVDNTMTGSFFRYVVQSYDLGVKRAIDYLVSRTKKNLLFLKNEIWKGRNLLDELMEHTFRNIITSGYSGKSVYVTENMKKLSKDFFRECEIGGVLCCSDADAVRLIGRLKNWRFRIPKDVSIINYGNTELTALFSPSITAIDCMYESMARKTASLIDQGNKAGKFEQYVIEPQLIIRKT
jgi:DNA-binding LacI/PurR family transcriptional regulator